MTLTRPRTHVGPHNLTRALLGLRRKPNSGPWEFREVLYLGKVGNIVDNAGPKAHEREQIPAETKVAHDREQ